MISGAKFSPDRRYRYWLLRVWDDSKPRVAFIGLNPSTADERQDDPTVAKCIRYAKRWGYGGMVMLNLFAFRATDPKDMMKARESFTDIIGGQENWFDAINGYIEIHRVKKTVAAWGNHGGDRGRQARSHLKDLHALGTNKDGSPKHPLYLRDDCNLRPY